MIYGMEDIFKPESKPILGLFSNSDSLYQIPDYQRPYSWVDDQVEQLWDDLTTAFENNLDDPNLDINYFLGSVITVPGEKGYQDVIDGQQRITTLMILFCVIRDLFPDINSEVNPDENPNVIKISKINRCISDDNELRRLKFKTASVNQNDFQSTIIKADTKLIVKPKQKNLKSSTKVKFENTASIFVEKLKNFELKHKGDIGKFVDYIFNSVKVIKITCTNRSFAIKLFQSLNATGLDLTPTDLLKSYLLSRLDEDLSKQFVDDWNHVEIITASTDFRDLNEMFVSYEYFKLAANPKKSLEDELQEIFKNLDPNTAINDVKNYVSVYDKNIFNSKDEIIYGLRYIRWSMYWKTIATAVFKMNYPNPLELLKELRRFYYLYWIAGKTLTQIKQSSFNMLKWIKDKQPLDFIKSELNKKMEDDRIGPFVLSNLRSDVYEQSWFKPVLLILEYAQSDNSNKSFIELSSNVHVEHIIPRKFKKFDEWSHIDDDFFDTYGNSIGNLTLLSGSKNIEASNNSFLTKTNVYKGLGKNNNKSNGVTGFEITKLIINENIDSNSGIIWGPDNTISRWNWFCDEFTKVFEFDTSSIKK
jgi:uncharacterized protein with ParB-like and HNH nuclease domain